MSILEWFYFEYAWCYQWNTSLLLILTITDLLIWFAYLAIPLVIYKQRMTGDIPHWVAWAFILFIVFCGTGHACDLVNRFIPIYGWKGFSNALTAVASIGTVIALRLHREWLQRPTRRQLEAMIESLKSANVEVDYAKGQTGNASDLAALNKVQQRLDNILIKLDVFERAVKYE